MGYESKLYFVRTSPHALHGEHEHRYAEKIVEINMCKVGGMPSCFKRPTNWFIFADDGNTEILEDKYEQPLYECEIEDLYQWLVNTMDADQSTYRRFPLLLSILEGFGDVEYSEAGFYLKLKPEWAGLKVLHFGY